jgi:hypothetical protein
MSDPQEGEGQIAPAAQDDEPDIPARLIVRQWLGIGLLLLMVLGTGWLAQRVVDRPWLLMAVLGAAFLLTGAAILLLLETIPLTLAALFVTFQKRRWKKRGDQEERNGRTET